MNYVFKTAASPVGLLKLVAKSTVTGTSTVAAIRPTIARECQRQLLAVLIPLRGGGGPTARRNRLRSCVDDRLRAAGVQR